MQIWRNAIDSQIVLGAVILFFSHGISLFQNYIRNKEYEQISLIKLMMQPYRRVVILHLTILIGGFLMMLLGHYNVLRSHSFEPIGRDRRNSNRPDGRGTHKLM